MKRIIVSGLGISGLGVIKFFEGNTEFSIQAYDGGKIEENNLPIFSNVEYFLGKNPSGKEEIDLLFLSPGISLNTPFVKEFIKRGVKVTGELDLAYENTRSENLVAITGTNGKTTTTMLTEEIFKNAFGEENVRVCGNIGSSLANAVKETNGEAKYVIEASSYQLELSDKFTPKVAAILNVKEDHISHHGSYEAYIKAKERIFQNQRESDFLILNFDDEITRKMGEMANSKILYFSMEEILAQGAYFDKDEQLIYIVKDGKKRILISRDKIKLLGSHNVENIMAASLIATSYGIDDEIIKNTVENFRAPKHRLEFVAEINGAKYVNDSKGTNVSATISAINSIDSPIILLAGGSDKGTGFDELTSILKGKVKTLILFGDTREKIKNSAVKNGYNEYLIVNSLKMAVKYAKTIAEKGDVVLLSPACASFDMYSGYEERGEDFCNIVKKLGGSVTFEHRI